MDLALFSEATGFPVSHSPPANLLNSPLCAKKSGALTGAPLSTFDKMIKIL
jgi:hypothetical protein